MLSHTRAGAWHVVGTSGLRGTLGCWSQAVAQEVLWSMRARPGAGWGPASPWATSPFAPGPICRGTDGRPHLCLPYTPCGWLWHPLASAVEGRAEQGCLRSIRSVALGLGTGQHLFGTGERQVRPVPSQVSGAAAEAVPWATAPGSSAGSGHIALT